jgi:glutamine synthetase
VTDSPGDVLNLIRDNEVQIIDLRFADLPGLMQHFSVPAHELTEESFDEGFGFDGSSIRGFQEIQESDMILVPDPGTAVLDPFRAHPTLILNCFVKDPVTGEPYTRDPRHVAAKAEKHLEGSGIAQLSYWGPEAEFYIFDSVRFDQDQHSSYYYVDAVEGAWNSGAEEGGRNLGYKPRYKEGYFPVPPTDHYQDLRSEMALALEAAGIPVEVQHHEVGTAGQAEIDIRFGTLLETADRVPLFYDESGYAQLSDLGRWYIGGLLTHAPALTAFTNPTTNSYRRLVPGYEAPVNLVYSQRNRSAAARIPLYSRSPKAKRVEFRVPDPSCNPYLAFAAMLMAGLDGVRNKIEPAGPLDKDLYELPPEELAEVPQVPGSLDEALAALEDDHEFLLEGDVFTQDVIDTWLAYKREREVDAVRLRPHPWEFHLYYDI